MGNQQFERGVGNQFLDDNVQVDIERNTSNQFDEDVKNRDIASNPVDSGSQNISGAMEVAGLVTVNDSGDANVTIIWTDGSGNETGRETPSDLQGITDSQGFNFIVKSTHFKILIEGTSNDTTATVNAH